MGRAPSLKAGQGGQPGRPAEQSERGFVGKSAGENSTERIRR